MDNALKPDDREEPGAESGHPGQEQHREHDQALQSTDLDFLSKNIEKFNVK